MYLNRHFNNKSDAEEFAKSHNKLYKSKVQVTKYGVRFTTKTHTRVKGIGTKQEAENLKSALTKEGYKAKIIKIS